MTLRDAFKAWAMSPRNVILAKNSRNAVEKVLMKKYNDIDLEQFTTTFVLRLFERCTEPQEVKTKAASILVYILCWGGDHGYCKRPAFDYTIASAGECKPEKPNVEYAKPLHELAGMTIYNEEPEEPIVKVKPEALEKRKAELEKRKTEDDMSEPKPRGKQPRPCVQIDMATLKPIKTWRSVSEVQKELGIKNVDRAIARKGVAGGFYWCDKGQEENFKPNKSSERQVVAEKKKKEKKQRKETPVSVPSQSQYKPYAMLPEGTVVMQERADISTFTNDELIDEMKRRGWKGNITITINVEL